MATVKQIALRLKYAKTSVGSLSKKLNEARAKVKKLEGDLKKVKVSEKAKSTTKTAAKKKPASPRKGRRV